MFLNLKQAANKFVMKKKKQKTIKWKLTSVVFFFFYLNSSIFSSKIHVSFSRGDDSTIIRTSSKCHCQAEINLCAKHESPTNLVGHLQFTAKHSIWLLNNICNNWFHEIYSKFHLHLRLETTRNNRIKIKQYAIKHDK